jgi:hypothetical protein
MKKAFIKLDLQFLDSLPVQRLLPSRRCQRHGCPRHALRVSALLHRLCRVALGHSSFGQRMQDEKGFTDEYSAR